MKNACIAGRRVSPVSVLKNLICLRQPVLESKGIATGSPTPASETGGTRLSQKPGGTSYTSPQSFRESPEKSGTPVTRPSQHKVLRQSRTRCPALLLALALSLLWAGLHAQEPPAKETVRFMAVDIFVDSKDTPLAAYQLEFKATAGDVKIVGIEGGDPAAFAEAPFYDPQAMQHERVIIAAFSTADKLPTGKTRVATIHVQVTGKADPRFELKLQTAADARGNVLQAETSFAERKPQ